MRKRVVIFSAFLSPLRSGAEACAEEVPLALKDDFDFVIITARMRPDLPARDMLQGKIPVYRMGYGGRFDKWLYPFLAPIAAWTQKPDVIHAILETYAGLALKFSKWILPTAKHILTLQTTNRSFLKSSIIKSADNVTAISKPLVTAAKLVGKEAVLIPNGIPLADLQTAANAYPKVEGRILFVGRLEKMKGIDTLLSAFASLPSRNTKLHIVGEGSQKESLQKLAAELGVGDRVVFLGYKSANDLYKEYAEAQVFCGLSRSEALGNVFLEAQAAGCAVIGTTVGGIPDSITHLHNGLLVAPDDPQAAQDALQKVLEDVALRSTLVTNAQEKVASYEWSSIARKYAELY